MSRGVKTALGISVLLNVFLIGAGVSAGLYAWDQFDSGALHQPTPLAIAARSLDTAVHDRLRQVMRKDPTGIKASFDAARAARAKAADLAAQPSFDRPAVEAQLASARTADMQGHAKVDAAVLDFMQTLSADQRAKLAPGLKARPPRPKR